MDYGITRPAVQQYLQDGQFDPELARQVASYSFQQVGWFLFFFLVAGSGLSPADFQRDVRRASRGNGAASCSDCCSWEIWFVPILRACSNPFREPYNDFINYKDKYETDGPNAVIKFLADKPYEQRVAGLPFAPPSELSLFSKIYGIEWIAQQLFRYCHNIQALEVVQMSRMPQDVEAFERAFQFPGTPPLTRRWQLTNTRYLLGPAAYLDGLNQQFDPLLRRFRIISNFRMLPKPGVIRATQASDFTAVPSPDGEYALFEFTGALPRVKLYSNWETNSPAALTGFTTNGLNPNQLQVFEMRGTNDFLTLSERWYLPFFVLILPERCCWISRFRLRRIL